MGVGTGAGVGAGCRGGIGVGIGTGMIWTCGWIWNCGADGGDSSWDGCNPGGTKDCGAPALNICCCSRVY